MAYLYKRGFEIIMQDARVEEKDEEQIESDEPNSWNI